MRKLVRALAVGLAALFCMGQAAPARVEYALTPVLRDGALSAVEVELSFRGEPDGETRLALPDSWGGQENLYRGVESLAVVGATMREDGPAARVLTHRPDARIRVRYRVVQDWQGAPTPAAGNPYRPIVQPGYFHLIGHAALIRPELAAATPVRLVARNLPPGWSFASDLEHAGATLERVGPSVSVAGDFRVLHGEDRDIRLAIRGRWNFSDAELMGDVSEIVAGQRRFWGDASSPFLVTVVQLEAPQNWTSIGGTGLDDAFAFFATPNAETAPLTRTLAHEALHTWIPAQIGGLPQADEAADYWLSEGFTDFYTGRLLVRDGLWGPAEFAADLNTMLRAYAQSPVRDAPNARIVADFWNDQNVQQLPYQRGRLLATLWDARLRAHGRGLDEVVLAMRADARGGGAHAVDLLAPAAHALGLDVRADIAAHAERGAAVLLPEDAFAPCGRVQTRNVAVPSRLRHRGDGGEQ